MTTITSTRTTPTMILDVSSGKGAARKGKIKERVSINTSGAEKATYIINTAMWKHYFCTMPNGETFSYAKL